MINTILNYISLSELHAHRKVRNVNNQFLNRKHRLSQCSRSQAIERSLVLIPVLSLLAV